MKLHARSFAFGISFKLLARLGNFSQDLYKVMELEAFSKLLGRSWDCMQALSKLIELHVSL